MRLDGASDIRIGDRPVRRVYVGGRLVWQKEETYVNLSAGTVWLTESNGYAATVDVYSNTQWNAVINNQNE